MHIKFDTKNGRIEWYKMSLLFVFRATQNNSDNLADTFLKWNNGNSSTWDILTLSPRKNALSEVQLFSIFYFKSEE